MENSRKIDVSLNMSLDVTADEREESSQLSTGYDAAIDEWRVIVKYIGSLRAIQDTMPGIVAIELFNQFGILQLPADQVEVLASLPAILYVEKPKQIYFDKELSVAEIGRSISCINAVQVPGGLTGRGVLLGVVDSGIDFTHPDFLDEDGQSRILFLWDQTGNGNPDSPYHAPNGYREGIEWSKEQLDEIISGRLTERDLPEGVRIPIDRGMAHGTSVAGIAAGNGSGSVGQRYRGIAVESPLLIVKLAEGSRGFSRTTEVMEGLDYMVKKAISLEMPISINISFGNNYGAHDGRSLFEDYISSLANVWKSVIAVASGNEGDAGHHASILLTGREEIQEIPFAIGPGERNISLQLWKEFVDDIAIFLEAPNGRTIQIQTIEGAVNRYRFGENQILVYVGGPSPYAMAQEIYFEWLHVDRVGGSGGTGSSLLPEDDFENGYLTEGIWKILLIPEKILSGRVQLWLPGTELVGTATRFLRPSPEVTLTLPSTARQVITVGAYRRENDTIAAFSGRGNTADGRAMPTLAAPGVNIMAPVAGGGYALRTGTSFAAPFVSGSAALMMEWGIVWENDPYLYGEKVKAYLIKGARKLPFQSIVPDQLAGWGALCLSDSFPEGTRFTV